MVWCTFRACCKRVYNFVQDLPTNLYQWTVDNYPEYLHPPRNYSSPNKTSWRVFKSIIDQRRENGENDIQVPDQPEKSDEKENFLNPEVLNQLSNIGMIVSRFEGTSYYVFGNLKIIQRIDTYMK